MEGTVRHFFALCVISFFFCSCGGRSAQTEFEFGNRLARAGLWQEAFYRWQKTLEKNGMNPALHNNLAVALEKMGKFEEAEKEYRKALELDPKNVRIQENFKQFQKYMKKGQDEK